MTRKVRSRAVVNSWRSCVRDYPISKTPQQLRFAVLAGQTARVRVPIGDAVERRVMASSFISDSDLTQGQSKSILTADTNEHGKQSNRIIKLCLVSTLNQRAGLHFN